MYCLQCFNSEDVLNNHKTNCMVVNGQQPIKNPEKDNNILKFTNFHKQIPVPFVIYADFQAITEKVQGCQPNIDKSYTETCQNHKDCGYGYKVICCYDNKYTKPAQIYRGENVVYKFMEKMLEEVQWCRKMTKKHFNKPVTMTKKDQQDFEEADKCHICYKKYSEKDTRVRAVRGPRHITGKYRGSAHQDCNMNFKLADTIPVIFRHLRAHNSHFIMQEIGQIAKKHTCKNKKGEEQQMNINVIPNNMEKYMAFMLGKHLVFLDSFQFMSSSLDKLVSDLPDKAFKYISEAFKKEQFKLMKQKGVYPYDYMSSFDKFNEKQLNQKKVFTAH